MKIVVFAIIIILFLLGLFAFLSRGKTETVPPDMKKKVEGVMERYKQKSVQCALDHKAAKSGSSKLGGLPDVHKDFIWPKWKGASLAFLGQINLSELKPIFANPDLPDKGILWFFFNKNQETWGFDPKDQGSWKVIYSENTEGLRPAVLPPDLEKANVFTESGVSFKLVESYPPLESDLVSGLSEEESDLYAELTGQDGVIHKLFGFPDPIQDNEMETQCQWASNGIYLGDAKGYATDKAKELVSGAKDWRLLLQIDSDKDLGMMWGDAGRLYFWYKKEDTVNFDKVWMILQCY